VTEGTAIAAQQRDRGGKALRVVVGILMMAATVLIIFGILSRFAGGWGVPFFSFTTDRGSTCTNDLTGYTCTKVTREDLNYWAEVALPEGTKVVSATYNVTHDYVLDARVEISKADAARGLYNLRRAYGTCKDHPSPLDLDGLKGTCVMANDDYTAQSDGAQASRLYLVGTGARPDGTRLVTLSIRSR
jgi:hypothetical protein